MYEYLSVDKTINTFRTQKAFLQSLIELRTDDILRRLEREGELSPDEVFEWAVRSAYGMRHYVVESATNLDWNQTQSDALINENHIDINARLRRYDRPSKQLFTSFRVVPPDGDRNEPLIEMVELTENKLIEPDEYLMFFPSV